MQFGNTPTEQTILQLQARKSFSFGVWLEDQNGRPLDITSTKMRMVVRKNVAATVLGSNANLLLAADAVIQAPTLGYAMFSLQAADLDWAPGEYPFTIAISDAGYSSTIIQGVVDLQQNMEYTGLLESYTPDSAVTHLRTVLRGTSVRVRTGPTLAPGQATFTHEDEDRLAQLYAGAVAAGATLNADMIPDGAVKVMMTQAERTKLANLVLQWVDIQGKPAFGDIITHDVSEFVGKGAGTATDIASGVILKERLPPVQGLRGITGGTGAAPSGQPHTLYFRYS
ncbi:minor tail protein [Microbacterium phage Pabst]|nr:minor tail protein [Microbacterium phage Pabst]